ncbi:hypothetical protein N7481_001572 [Penicillium waksmanii]|uniref:uncharacterized protein n=1 Tax=Penicillium waksmanii TaxID=69791 RepID=UPI0025476DF4|nr:uncharacterized protein N7481_001572 [Penicillium waksmanii]KAJ6001163.1 hypothetical protein N7481_001572 [Penicillium waksmanii]
MDAQDAYYVALVLDPRFKTLLLDKELGLVTAPKDNKRQGLAARVLQKLQPQVIQPSDIDRYFEESVVTVDEKMKILPADDSRSQDYLAIPAAEVAVEKLLSRGRDLLGVRRHSMKGETMRKVMLLRDI